MHAVTSTSTLRRVITVTTVLPTPTTQLISTTTRTVTYYSGTGV
jgi:hypothetical protein